MSIIIKGLNVPKSCLTCPLRVYLARLDTYWCRGIGISMDSNENNRPDWCPIEEFPDKHGRLFDEDEVKACLRNTPDSDDKWDAIALLEWAIEKRCCVDAEE